MKKRLVAMLLATALLATACGSGGEKTQTDGGEDKGVSATLGIKEEKAEWKGEELGVFEAETGTQTGNARVDSSIAGYSGEGYVTGFENDDDTASVEIQVETDGFYDLQVKLASLGGYKENYLYVDGQMVGSLALDNDVFRTLTMEHVYLTAGTHTVTIKKNWGWIAWDKVTVTTAEPFDAGIYEVSAKLINPNASDNAKRVMSYLVDNYGKNVISGQYCDAGMYGTEMHMIWKETGKFPAMLGLDMGDYTPSRVENGTVGKSIDQAIEAWEDGAIITMCWHWNAPTEYITGTWYSAFYKEHTSINLDKIMSGKDEKGYNLLIEDMDAIAKELKRLQELDIPVLWRPLHEASGGWFWWGNCKAESYLELYKLMYDKFTNEYGLNNLIWVWNGQNAEWYPGDEYVDIVGEDIYPGYRVYTSQYPKYMEAYDYTGVKKMVVLSENGCLMDPELMARDGAMWGYFGTWGGDFVYKKGLVNLYSEEYTELEMLKKVYQHELVITKDELPDLKTYPIREEAM